MADQAGFLSFVRGVMGITTTQLPDNSSAISDAYAVSIDTVNLYIGAISTTFYNLAVYNLGGDYLLNWAPDQTGQTFFADYRKANNMNGFTAGVVASSADEGTSNALLVPDAFKGLTISDLQELKTPYGRAYLGIAQKWGTNWGLS